MKYVNYDPSKEHGGCIIRSFSKMFNKDYYEVKEELEELGKKYNCRFDDDRVIDEYFKDKNVKVVNYKGRVVDYDYSGKYLVYCYKDNHYHMVCIIDNVVYDRDERYKEMDVELLFKVGD